MKKVLISPRARAEYVDAFRTIAERIAATLAEAPARFLPIKMIVAGGAAMHFYAGERVSHDIDAVFSRRLALPEGLEVSYRDADGAARHLYFDTQYNDSFGLLHEDAHDGAVALDLPGFDSARLLILMLAPIDLAVSKIARFGEQDRSDIITLAKLGLVTATALRKRADEALGGYVGDLNRVRLSIDLACKLVDAVVAPTGAKRTGSGQSLKKRR